MPKYRVGLFIDVEAEDDCWAVRNAAYATARGIDLVAEPHDHLPRIATGMSIEGREHLIGIHEILDTGEVVSLAWGEPAIDYFKQVDKDWLLEVCKDPECTNNRIPAPHSHTKEPVNAA